MFKRNEGIIDRTLRVALAIVLLSVGLFLLGGLQGNVPGLIVAGFGLLPLITGLTGFCPLYVPFGISTLEKEKELMARCMSMMAGSWRGNPSASQMCGPCSPSIGETPDQPGETA
ncbi:MAG TPA: DUF2892 domain-containing protein [Anaerolineales bacterium]